MAVCCGGDLRDCRGLPDEALRAAVRGWPVFPLRPYSKQPWVRNWERQASTDPDRVRAWWTATPQANIGLACGPAGLVVVDLDSPGHVLGHGALAGGAAARRRRQAERGRPGGVDDRLPAGAVALHGRQVLAELAAAFGAPLPATYTVATPSGEHLYFTAPADVELRNTAGALGPCIDTRAGGGYVVAAGSVLRARGRIHRYRTVLEVPAVPLPDWIVDALRSSGLRVTGSAADGRADGCTADWPAIRVSPTRLSAYVAAALAGETRAVAQAQPGTRNHTLFRAAAKLGELVGSGALAEETARGALLEAAAGHFGIEGFTLGEARRAIGNGLRRGRRNPRWLSDF